METTLKRIHTFSKEPKEKNPISRYAAELKIINAFCLACGNIAVLSRAGRLRVHYSNSNKVCKSTGSVARALNIRCLCGGFAQAVNSALATTEATYTITRHFAYPSEKKIPCFRSMDITATHHPELGVLKVNV